MTKSPTNNSVGDTVAPAQRQNAESLRCAVDQALHIGADGAPKPAAVSKTGSYAAASRNDSQTNGRPGTCVQTLWFSFFFDGTGNNMTADVGSLKHSNVARLFRAMPENNSDIGRYSFYIPGVGTYCRDAADDGGGFRGYGFGDKGAERLKWAFDLFDENMKTHISRAYSPLNAIVEVNLAAFGFSRGAALARAFIHRFAALCVQDDKGNWRLQKGKYIIRIRFMGLFDTVASVGPPMATNTTGVIDVALGVSYVIRSRLSDAAYSNTRPQKLAFAENARAGADPAPGKYNGHSSWGDDMRIPEMVEEVRHFVAAHEIRNSFPLESVSILEKGRITRPIQFFETVYPGVHSDVGGSYRPGEGGRSDLSEDKLGLIPLADMYMHAIVKGVPLLPKDAWEDLNFKDFRVDKLVVDAYRYYLSRVPAASTLGDLFNAHLALYYAWRFRAIRRKENGDHTDANHINKNAAVFTNEKPGLEKDISALEVENDLALKKLCIATQQRQTFKEGNLSGSPKLTEGLVLFDQNVVSAQRECEFTKDKLLRAKAKLDALPNDTGLQYSLEMYDKQLLQDARAIHAVYSQPQFGGAAADSGIRKKLRPHYKAMMTAYENEYDLGPGKKGLVGLTDKTIIDFFDRYVHDSLAGFAKDATLPSDPRAIYLGGSEKYAYASLDKADGDSDSELVRFRV
jgi:uncharacterized protein (DUF2235 family)